MTERKKLHPQLEYVFPIVGRRALERIETELMNIGLLDQDGCPQGGLTPEGTEVLGRAVVLGIYSSLSRAEVKKLPEGYAYDQLELADQMCEGLGSPKIEVMSDDRLRVTFEGHAPLVREVTVPLNPDEVNDSPDNPCVEIDLGKKHTIRPGFDIDEFDNKRFPVSVSKQTFIL